MTKTKTKTKTEQRSAPECNCFESRQLCYGLMFAVQSEHSLIVSVSIPLQSLPRETGCSEKPPTHRNLTNQKTDSFADKLGTSDSKKQQAPIKKAAFPAFWEAAKDGGGGN